MLLNVVPINATSDSKRFWENVFKYVESEIRSDSPNIRYTYQYTDDEEDEPDVVHCFYPGYVFCQLDGTIVCLKQIVY